MGGPCVGARRASRISLDCACAAAASRSRNARCNIIARTSLRCWPNAAPGKASAWISFDGTGYGDDGSIWGGEFFAGSLRSGFERVAHLRPAALSPEAMPRRNIQCRQPRVFLRRWKDCPSLSERAIFFSVAVPTALQLLTKMYGRSPTTSVGRLFDTAAALLGFTRDITFEGQAAMWVEHIARAAGNGRMLSISFSGWTSWTSGRCYGRLRWTVERAERRGNCACFSSAGLRTASPRLSKDVGAHHHVDVVVLSGGVFQNELLLEDLKAEIRKYGIAALDEPGCSGQ